MSMTVPLDLGLTAGMGMAFSLAARERWEEKSLLGSKPYRVGMAFNAVAGVGVAAWCYRLAPDWMLMYYADHAEIPAAVQVGMFGLYPLSFTLGFLITPQPSRFRPSLEKKVFAGVLASEAGYILLSLKRLLRVGPGRSSRRGKRPASSRPPWRPSSAWPYPWRCPPCSTPPGGRPADRRASPPIPS